MLKYALVATALSLTPAIASAATVPASLTGPNDLSQNDYTDELVDIGMGSFSLSFVAPDAPRSVTAALTFSGTLNPTASFGFSTGDAFTIPGVSSLPANGGPVNFTQTITFLVSTVSAFTFNFVAGPNAQDDAKNVDYSLTVSSTAVPLPAALPLLAAGIGGLAVASRLRKKA